MKKRGSYVYSEARLKRMWEEGKTNVEIAEDIGCPVRHVEYLRDRHKLPARQRSYHGPQEDDPTLEQIAERAAECRARRPDPGVHREERVSVPRYSWDGRGFQTLG